MLFAEFGSGTGAACDQPCGMTGTVCGTLNSTFTCGQLHDFGCSCDGCCSHRMGPPPGTLDNFFHRTLILFASVALPFLLRAGATEITHSIIMKPLFRRFCGGVNPIKAAFFGTIGRNVPERPEEEAPMMELAGGERQGARRGGCKFGPSTH
jgi:hypothetical protein